MRSIADLIFFMLDLHVSFSVPHAIMHFEILLDIHPSVSKSNLTQALRGRNREAKQSGPRFSERAGWGSHTSPCIHHARRMRAMGQL